MHLRFWLHSTSPRRLHPFPPCRVNRVSNASKLSVLNSRFAVRFEKSICALPSPPPLSVRFKSPEFALVFRFVVFIVFFYCSALGFGLSPFSHNEPAQEGGPWE